MSETDARKVRLGIVGLGNVAQEHMKGIAASYRINLIAGADLDGARCRKAESDFGLRSYGSAEDMIAHEDLEGVLVLTPARYHLPVVAIAAEARLPVLCEKPLASDLADAKAMIEIVEQNSILFQFGASYRFLPAVQTARQIIHSNGIGQVRSCLEHLIGGRGSASVEPLPLSHYPEGEPGGTPMGLVDHGVHLIDAFAWMTGQSIHSVYGCGNISGHAPRPESVMFTLGDGAIGHLFYDEGTVGLSLPGEGVFSAGGGWNVEGYVAPGGYDPYPCTLSIYGSTGALRIYPYANLLYHATLEGVTEIPLPKLPEPNHFRAQAEAFADLIRNPVRPAVPDIDAGLAAQRTVLAVYDSMKSKSLQTLDKV